MKKLYLIIISLLISGAASAQSKTEFGLKGGLNLANNTLTVPGATVTASSLTSFHVGGFITTKIQKKLTFQPELLFSSQGYKGNDGIESTLYLNFPFMLRYNVAGGFHLEAGPQLGFLLSAKAQFNNGQTFDDKSNYNPIDFGFNAGAEYQFPSGLLLNARYNLGIANIAKTEPNSSVRYTNRVFSAGIGFRF